MDAIGFLEISKLKNKLKNLFQVKHLLIIAFIFYVFVSDLYSKENITITNARILNVIYFILLVALWVVGLSFLAFSKSFNIDKADTKFLLLSPIKANDICNYVFRKKAVLISCINILVIAYFILYFCVGNANNISTMVYIAVLFMIVELNVFYLLYRSMIKRKNIKNFIKIISIISYGILVFLVWSYITGKTFAKCIFEKAIEIYGNFNIAFWVMIIVLAFVAIIVRIFREKNHEDIENQNIIFEQSGFDNSPKEYDEKKITSISKKIHVEMLRNKKFRVKQFVMTIYGIILAILCVGLCETFGDTHGMLIACMFVLMYAILSGFVFGLDIFETEIKKHYIHLIPQSPNKKFIKVSIPYLLNQFVVGILMIIVIDVFNTCDINSVLMSLVNLCFLGVSLSSELIFFWIYKNENTSDSLLLFINGMIKVVVFTPSLVVIVATILFSINQILSLISLMFINSVITLVMIRVSHKVLQ